MKKHSYLLLLLFVPALFACEPEEPEVEQPIVGTWNLIRVESKSQNGNWAEGGSECQLDNQEEYRTDGTWILYDNLDYCPGGSGVMYGTWELAANNTKIIYTYEGVSGSYESTVETLNESQMVIIHNAGDLDNTLYRNTYQKQ